MAPTDDAILKAALKTITLLINESTGMSHPSDKKTVVWTFKILHEKGIDLNGPLIRRCLLEAGVPQCHAKEIQDAAERIAGGGYFRNIGSKPPLKAGIFERWVQEAGESDIPESSESTESTKPLLFTDSHGPDTKARVKALATTLAIATRDSTAATLVVTTKKNLSHYGDVFTPSALKALRKTGRATIEGVRMNLATAQDYRGRAPEPGPVLIMDCKPDLVELAYYDDSSSTAVVYVPWTSDEAAHIASLGPSAKLQASN